MVSSDYLGENQEVLVEPFYTREISKLFSNTSTLMEKHFGLPQGEIGRIANDLGELENFGDRKNIQKRVLEIVKRTRENLSTSEMYVNESIILITGEWVISLSPQEPQKGKVVKNKEGKVVDILYSVGDRRKDLVTIFDRKIRIKNGKTSIEIAKDELVVLTDKPDTIGLPSYQLWVSNELVDYHRTPVRLVRHDDDENESQIAAQYWSDVLGCEVYYDDLYQTKSIGVYFKLDGKKIFGLFKKDGEGFRLNSMKEIGQESDFTREFLDENSELLPRVEHNNSGVIVARQSREYSFPDKLDIKKCIDGVWQYLQSNYGEIYTSN